MKKSHKIPLTVGICHANAMLAGWLVNYVVLMVSYIEAGRGCAHVTFTADFHDF